jgi:hypothetical protein
LNGALASPAQDVKEYFFEPGLRVQLEVVGQARPGSRAHVSGNSQAHGWGGAAGAQKVVDVSLEISFSNNQVMSVFFFYAALGSADLENDFFNVTVFEHHSGSLFLGLEFENT